MSNREGQHLDKQFGNYLLTKSLGEGGFAEVYLGEHIHTHTQVAVKVLTAKFADDEIAQFRSEAHIMMELDHPNIIHVDGFDMEGRIPFIVMTYASNGSLRHRHPKGAPIPLITLVSYVNQIADALQYIHDRHLIHRDLKPENILIGAHNEILLSDFGIAAIAHGTSSLQTQGPSGTIYYMAPEQLQGKPRIASDQYALGIIVYEWLCGYRPFTGTYTEIATQHILTPPRPLYEYIPNTPQSVEQVVMKALTKDPHQRFRTVLEFAQALEQASQPVRIQLSKPLPSHQQPPTMPRIDLGGDNALPSISDRPTHITPQTPSAQPTASSITRPGGESHPQQETRINRELPSTHINGGLPQLGTAISEGLPRNRARVRNVQHPASGPASRSGNRQATPPGRTRAVISRPGTRSGRGASPSRQGMPLRARGTARRQESNLVYGIVAGIVAIILVLVVVFFLVPAANVTVVLPAQNYSAPIKLFASPSSQTNDTVGTIQASIAQKDFTISGIGKASGTAKANTGLASGVVFFTNNGTSQITIPSNIEVSTGNGISFVTQSNVRLGAASSGVNNLPIPIQAKVSGDSGNVAAGSITVIPLNSANQIAQASNIAVSALNLLVTNVIATSGGGTLNVPMITQNDLDNAQASLSAQLQDRVNTWIKAQLAPEDVAGKPVVTPKSTQTPNVNTVLQSGDTFPANLAESVEVPVVRGAVLQAVTMAQLNIALGKTQPNQQLASATQSSAPPIQIPSFTPVSNGLSMMLSFTATGKSVPKISIEAIQSKIHGQTASDAEITLKRLLPAIERVTVKISPSLLPWIPQVQSHISVNFVAA